jgi:outer membrane protein OmpA-like peptidoglycan-associated protein
MAEDWFENVRKYVADADEKVVGKIVSYLGIALRNRDSSLVSFSDPEEVGRVRERYLRKKLALSDSDDVLNAGLDWVKDLMSDDRTKNRVTVYYLLAHYFGKLDLFGGPTGTSAASLGGAAAAIGAAGLAGLGGASAAATPPAAPEYAAPSAPEPEVVPVTASAPDAAPPVQPPPREATTDYSDRDAGAPARPTYAANLEEDDGGRSGWPRWLTWLLIALAVIALFFLLRGCIAERQTATTDAASGEATLSTEANLAGAGSDASAGTGAAVPAGAGVVSGVKDNKPMLTVYFESGQSAVSNDMATAAGTLKAYLDANPGSKLAVSGYNDPSGNAALNAELSKKRAQGVAAALAAAGIPESAVELVKPADTTSASVTPEQARRVEVTVK